MILVILHPERETVSPNVVFCIVLSKFIFSNTFLMTQPTTLPMIYPIRRIIAAGITLGIDSTIEKIVDLVYGDRSNYRCSIHL